MSTTYLGRALDAPADLTPTQRLVLILLARDADDSGMTWTAVRRIAQSANISDSTAVRTLRHQKERGLVQHITADGRRVRLVFGAPATHGPEGTPA
ncbi:helix-turn-helix domain-containing protein [Streptomyces sp. 900116325]